MKAQTHRFAAILAVLLPFAEPVLARTSTTAEGEYNSTAQCAAIESSGTSIPNHTLEETSKVAAGFKQRAQTLGERLGRTADQVDADIDGRREHILFRLHGPDAMQAQQRQAGLVKFAENCRQVSPAGYAPAQTSMTPEHEYDVRAARCAALESSGVTIPNQTPEETVKMAGGFEQRAQALGQQLGRTADQVNADLAMRRKRILYWLQGPDAAQAAQNQAALAKVSQECPMWLTLDILHNAGLVH